MGIGSNYRGILTGLLNAGRTRRMTPEQMKSRLQQAYPDGDIEVVDLTGTHDHYQVHIRSQTFKNLSRINCHKHVMDVFSSELKTGEVHALTIKTEIKE